LLKEHEQGGDGGYRGSLKYHNSFLIKDFERGYVLETCGKHWALQEIRDVAAISNCYSITDDYCEVDPDTEKPCNFKTRYENKLVTFFTKGDARRKYAYNYLKSSDRELTNVMNVLRSHMTADQKIKKGMKSICIHSGPFIKSEATSSMIVDYIGDKFIIWFTGSPHPCVSLFKPIVFSGDKTVQGFDNVDYSVDYSNDATALARALVKNYSLFVSEIKTIRDKYESDFRKLLYSDLDTKDPEQLISECEKCFAMEKEYVEQIRSLIG
jgi:secernin